MKNALKEKLKKGNVAVGTLIQIGHPDITEILSQLDFDYLLIDAEHGPFGIKTMQVMLQAMSGTAAVPIIRAPSNDPVFIKRALDIGACGLLIPLVSSKQDAQNTVSAIKYPPAGIRGVGPRRASRYFLDVEEYFATADEEILTLVQIETKEAVNNAAEILSVEGIDGYFLGPMDLAAGLGHIGNEAHPEVEEAINKVLVMGKKAKKIGGIYTFNTEDAQKRIKQGFQFIALGVDSAFLIKSARESLERMRMLTENL